MSQAVSASQSISMLKAHVPPGEGEHRVNQYGPEWVAACYLGRDVRDGNIIANVTPKRKR